MSERHRPHAKYEVVIGLEVHVHMHTASKLFSPAPVRYGDPPNHDTHPLDLGLPGVLPVLNRRAVELGIRAGLALGCRINEVSIFARKNYFYPDLPKGYQISQYERPIALRGAVEYESGGVTRRVGITRAHLEEDAGKSLHEGFPDSDRRTYLDFNRSGVPLLEIVTEPDIRSAAEAGEFFSRLRAVLVAIGVNDGNMEEGSLRCDANVSVRPSEDAPFGTKAEVKNLNSFRYVQKALEYEIARQAAVLREGGKVEQETRLWDAAAGRTVSMRSKEEAHDYRYFPEPDLPPLEVSLAWIEEIRRDLPELPDARRRRFATQYGLPDYDAAILTQSRTLGDYYEATAAASGSPKMASNWIMGELTRKMNELGVAIDAVDISPEALAGLIRLVDSGTITGPIAKDVFEKMYGTGRSAESIVAAEGLASINDDAALEAAVREAIARNETAVAQYRAGKQQTFGFLVGQVMKATKGKANPATVNALMKKLLES